MLNHAKKCKNMPNHVEICCMVAENTNNFFDKYLITIELCCRMLKVAD